MKIKSPLFIEKAGRPVLFATLTGTRGALCQKLLHFQIAEIVLQVPPSLLAFLVSFHPPNINLNWKQLDTISDLL